MDAHGRHGTDWYMNGNWKIWGGANALLINAASFRRSTAWTIISIDQNQKGRSNLVGDAVCSALGSLSKVKPHSNPSRDSSREQGARTSTLRQAGTPTLTGGR